VDAGIVVEGSLGVPESSVRYFLGLSMCANL
jgi:hypothetical protein